MPRPAKKTVTVTVRVGEEVGVPLAGRVVAALVVEDRGNLGPGGTRLVRVEVQPSKNEAGREPERFEIPVDALVSAPA